MTGERESRDLKRAREYIEHALTGVRVHVPEPPANLTEALFGAYTCKRCSSYLHSDADHGEGRD